jgi:hypothetical protein
MRAICVALLLATVGCGDDSTGSSSLDMSGSSSSDLAGTGPDLTGCTPRSFQGFPGTANLLRFDCSCGCSIDGLQNNLVNSMWGTPHSSGASFVPMQGVGLGIALSYSGAATAEYGSLVSEGATSPFYLDGDFDMLVDYDLGATPPPGVARLILGVRNPTTLSGTPVYEIERLHQADGSDDYATMLGGVPPVFVTTTATKGTLRLTRAGFMLTSYADGNQVSMLIAQSAGRLAITLTATLGGCTTSDGGSSCGYTPRWKLLRMSAGTLVNLPQ